MNPVQIDTRSWLKFGFIAIFFSSVIFASGFIVGYKNATKYNQTLSNTASTIGVENEVSNEPADQVISKTFTDSQSGITADAIETVTDITDADLSNVVKEAVVNETASKSSVVSSEPINIAKTIAVKPRPNSNVASLESEDLSEIKLTIQAGLYGTLSSAESVASKLKADNYDAYVSEYVTKKNEINYNVRVGYFVDKKSALPTLYAFRREKKSDAYLVKFSADSVILIVEDDSI